jgi:hydrogenase maturation factor
VAEVSALLPAGRAEVIVEGRCESVDASLVEPIAPGDLLLIHAGVALTTLEATRT